MGSTGEKFHVCTRAVGAGDGFSFVSSTTKTRLLNLEFVVLVFLCVLGQISRETSGSTSNNGTCLFDEFGNLCGWTYSNNNYPRFHQDGQVGVNGYRLILNGKVKNTGMLEKLQSSQLTGSDRHQFCFSFYYKIYNANIHLRIAQLTLWTRIFVREENVIWRKKGIIYSKKAHEIYQLKFVVNADAYSDVDVQLDNFTSSIMSVQTNEIFISSSDRVTSLNYPMSSPRSMEYLYVLKTYSDYVLSIKIESQQYNKSDACDNQDYINVLDGSEPGESNLLDTTKICGKISHNNVASTRNIAAIQYITNCASDGTLFEATVSVYKNGGSDDDGDNRQDNYNPDVGFTGIMVALMIGFILLLTVICLACSRRFTRQEELSRREEIIQTPDYPDVVDLAAPPSYQEVMETPERFPRTQFILQTPTSTPTDSPNMRFLRDNGSSIRGTFSDTDPSDVEEEEGRPPAYPGLPNGDIVSSGVDSPLRSIRRPEISPLARTDLDEQSRNSGILGTMDTEESGNEDSSANNHTDDSTQTELAVRTGGTQTDVILGTADFIDSTSDSSSERTSVNIIDNPTYTINTQV